MPEEEPSHDAAQDGGGFNRRDPDQRLRAVEARAEEQGTERQPLRDLVDTNRYDEREVQRSAAGGVGSLDFMARRQGQAIGSAVNGQGEHHGGSDLGKVMGYGFVEVASGTSRADVVHVLADEVEEGVAGPHGDHSAPPVQGFEALRQDREDGHPQQRARAQADQPAEPLV